VNARPVGTAYAGALDSPCRTCGAAAGDYCTRRDSTGVPRIRKMPCCRRCPPSSPLPAEEPSRRHQVAFDEPLHEAGA
jgi:hypothetical protein